MSERYTARQRVLDAAAKCVLGDRNAAYGPPTQDFDRTAGMWTSLFGHLLKDDAEFRAQDVAAAIICVKLSRAQHSAKEDNWIDTAGYAACGAECEEAYQDDMREALTGTRTPDDNPAPCKRPRVYLAGAIEHAKDAVTWREQKTRLLARWGLVAVSPADPALEEKLKKAKGESERMSVMREIQVADRALLDSCDGVYVRWDLEAARGAGTVSEVERAACSGKPVVIWNALPDFQQPPLWLRANASKVEQTDIEAASAIANLLATDRVTWVDLEGQ